MEIKVLDLVEEEDGSGLLTVDLDQEAKEFLIEHALIGIITDAAKETIAEHKIEDYPGIS